MPTRSASPAQELAAVGLGERVDALSRRTFRRRAAARGDRPRAGAVAAHPDRRRADRQSRPGDRPPDRRPAVRQGQAERGMTLVLVTHDPSLAARCARQVVDAFRPHRDAAPRWRRPPEVPGRGCGAPG